jgi:aryl-alcohol dehydrogenase-like predicted oxidoreductase
MQKRRFGKTDLEITPIGFGSWAIGGGNWEYGWGPQDDQAATEAIQKAVELGINWIDTAPVYGLGHSEELVGQALKGMSERPFVFTKCSMIWDEQRKIRRGLKTESVRRECEASLKRLGMDAIDLYQMHWPNPEEEIEEGWSALATLKEEGKVRYIGVSNFNVEQMKRIQKIAAIDSLQPQYSLLNRKVEQEVLPFCEANGIAVIVYSPMGSGLLTGSMTRERVANFAADDWRRKSPQFQEPKLSSNLALASFLGELAARHGLTAGEVAIAWTLRQSAVTGAIVGGRNARQVNGTIEAGEFRLTEGEVREIEEFEKGRAA